MREHWNIGKEKVVEHDGEFLVGGREQMERTDENTIREQEEMIEEKRMMEQEEMREEKRMMEQEK